MDIYGIVVERTNNIKKNTVVRLVDELGDENRLKAVQVVDNKEVYIDLDSTIAVERLSVVTESFKSLKEGDNFYEVHYLEERDEVLGYTENGEFIVVKTNVLKDMSV